jgi:hypothetical protein
MRLKPEKIDRLAKSIFHFLAAQKEVELDPDQNKIVGVIRKAISDDLIEEEEIEHEARKKLEAHAQEIQRSGANYEKLLQKAMQEVARKRKFSL